ncbi:hypothetical protein EW146_g8103 [Bondarzewia mesenterica]|uniref:Methyltransferase domain-containing protein n=1 Tax=Bondarzewia mesenterica TaxID=1095465 RepID=A0A4V3XDW4_9AGAM|nr:hypothetical protein EW146_g8103 [Bondarzewia mesenterica]
MLVTEVTGRAMWALDAVPRCAHQMSSTISESVHDSVKDVTGYASITVASVTSGLTSYVGWPADHKSTVELFRASKWAADMPPTAAVITRESSVPNEFIRPLDESLFQPSNSELDFLKSVISGDEHELRRRVFEVQKYAYEQHPYPCICQFNHVSLMMSTNKVYPSIVETGKTNGTILLDLGCCMGTDVRKIVHDGYPADHVVGCDLRPEFIALGYKLYRDTETYSIRFLTADIFDLLLDSVPSSAKPLSKVPLSQVSTLDELIGRVSHIYIGALFHLFDEQTQLGLAQRLVSLLKKTRGATIFGRHQGLEEAGMIGDHMKR